MTRLLDALRQLGLEGEISPSGRWITVRGERGAIYVAETSRGTYYTWCDLPDARAVQFYSDPDEAIRAGLKRAAGREATGGGRPSSL